MGPRSQAHRLVDVLGPPKSPVPSVSIGVYPWLNSFPSALIRFNHTLFHASSDYIPPSACPVLGPDGTFLSSKTSDHSSDGSDHEASGSYGEPETFNRAPASSFPRSHETFGQSHRTNPQPVDSFPRWCVPSLDRAGHFPDLAAPITSHSLHISRMNVTMTKLNINIHLPRDAA